jgi:drug/metabolite transporter (DMT)-like permease
MTSLSLALCIICQFFMIGGQLLLKRAMSPESKSPAPSRRRMQFGLGIGCLSVWFFLWLGVLEQLPLSRAFPFEGLNPALMAVGAWLLLKERLSVKAWMGVAMVCGGIVVVAMS